mgnify:CR=1 FL=1
MHGVTNNSVTVDLGGKTLTLSTGKYAKQAGGAIVVESGDSKVLVTAVCDTRPTRFDFMPLTVDYQDRTGSYGAIPGGFLKREGRGNERTTLISRVIDRPIRPLFPKTFRNETQIIATVMSYDKDHETDWMSLCGASAALSCSDAPVKEAVAGVRVCQVNGELILNPTLAERQAANLNVMVAGTAESVIMVEGGADQVSEELMLDALDMAHEAIKLIVAAINELDAKVGIAKREWIEPEGTPAEFVALVDSHKDAMVTAMAVTGKHERGDALREVKTAIKAGLADRDDSESAIGHAMDAFDKMKRGIMRATVISDARRIDGRGPADIRAIWCEAGLAERAHGSAVFTRGETQAFATIALGTERDNQRIDWPGALAKTREWMLTYSFPPFSTGEARPLRAPKRREVGHGVLAHRAIAPVLPSQAEFPYVLRSTVDVLESNGSSSMATVCSTSLALMDAGVPVKAAVAGIAMGLIKEGDDFAVLSDILGSEDHLGDMDFKVTGTREGITAFQMDCKIAGVPREVMSRALSQARDGRLHILDEMAKTLDTTRGDLSQWAPRITTLKIKVDKIRDIIGPGGKVIRGMQDATGCTINVEDDGTIRVAATNGEDGAKCIAMIRELTQEAEIGKLYMGVVKRITDFGAFVEIFPGTDGLVHISHLAEGRVERVTDICSEGDELLVRVIDIDRSGKIRLSRKEALNAGA